MPDRPVAAPDDLPSSPCGGTHMRRLHDLEGLEVDVKVKKGRIKVGYRAAHRPQE